MRYKFEEDIFGDAKIICNKVNRILRELEPLVNEDLRFDIRLILNELLINCHEHGNKYDAKKPIHLNFEANDKEINILVKDEGTGIISRNIANDKYRTNGRGLLLVENLVDKFQIESNKVRCKILISS